MPDITSNTSIGELVDALGSRLQLKWTTGANRRDLVISDRDDYQGQPLAGSLNLIHPNQIQLIGTEEIAYLDGLLDSIRRESYRQLFFAEPAAIICTDGVEPPRELLDSAETTDTPLLQTGISDRLVANHLNYYLSQALAERDTIHGVFMEVFGTGVLLTGMAAVGKSELALELITRGHRLIADDAPEFSRIAPDIVTGVCPPLLQDFIEVRGLGLLNVRRMFGDTSIKKGKYLRLIIHIAQMDDSTLARLDRLTGTYSTRNVLGLEIPKVTVPLAPGRNMAIIVETAVRQYMLRQQGYEASEDFINRQRKAISDTTKEE
ncbi:HPr(Ser) kinase/phosphatase [Solemya elarraichensis gill symbiont]|uniref:HPr(Ser) kinase/phosphatase n=1 Tax=Solemya elarraichensis gill symbiont TaxID=1918949 RepID=UPI00099852A3|nr:HPr(Ser) kinase/phosphatase [Solemya elarraichensis gill symbiont]